VHGREADELLAMLAPRTGPERLLDFMARTGPYGDGFGAAGREGGLTLDLLLANPHGIDFGPLEPRLPDLLRTESGMVELAPDPIVGDVERLRGALVRTHDGILLVGRRDLRSNNSWMHNLSVLVKGKPRCTLHVHPDEATRLGLTNGGLARVSARRGSIDVPVEVTDAVMPGVVSLPHGWGHDQPGVVMATARANAGVNSNAVADEELFDALSGNAVLNGLPVTVERAPAA
jgi:hypothetical protein